MIRIAGGATLADRLEVADRPWQRARGLLGRTLGDRAGLLIRPASQIHTFGMRYPIDVIFCSEDLRVLYVRRSLPPWRITRWVRSARMAIELREGSVPDTLARGTQLELVNPETERDRRRRSR